ncbi:Thiamin biosynthesis lipoprotein ApbE [hydrothermal vent metagenome]|uniref:FAD:protein FMN transferase n=1 Tax=hydrothermal vent metagenome TaxID=652676 RepID=A0A3B0UT91_9ZZZZ
MKKNLIILVLLVFILSCQNQPESLVEEHYFIFGTIVNVLIWHENDAEVAQALAAVETRLNGMHTQWHAWKAGRLNEINIALRAGDTLLLTDEEVAFIQTTQQLSRESLDNFNPAIGELINLWGFHTDIYPILQPPPSDSAIQLFLQNLPTMADIVIVNNQISSTNKSIWLDYGGVAKGYAIDVAINILKKHKIENAIVNAGGDLRSIGSKGDKNWQVAIREPNSEDILAIIVVQGDESVFTSGNYARYKEFNGKRYAHIIDPKTGYGVEQIVSATVIANNGTRADAAATALIVAGAENWQTVLENMQLNQVLLIDADGNCVATKMMMNRIKPTKLNCTIVVTRKIALRG